LRITGYSTAYAKFERRTKLVIIKLQCNRALIESGWGVSAGPVTVFTMRWLSSL